jgi:hypothetical protein
MINSAGYSYGENVLDSDSTLIYGGNNIGKTSQISALLFLLVVDRKQMTFEKKHTAKAALQHYFPSANKSYLIFEGFDKNKGYLTLILKRNDNGIDYYLLNGAFEKKMLIKETDNSILAFDEALKNPAFSSNLKELKRRDEILGIVYQRNKGQPGFIHLASSIKDSKSFRDLINYLFNLPEIDNTVLKEGILISQGKSAVRAVFNRQEGEEKIREYRKLQNEIENSLSAKDDYIEFSRLHEELGLKREDVSNRIRTMLAICYEEAEKLRKLRSDIQNKKLQKESLASACEQERDGLQSQIVEISKEKGAVQARYEESSNRLTAIESYGAIEWLQAELTNLEKEYHDMEVTSRSMRGSEASIEELDAAVERKKKAVDNHKAIIKARTERNDLVSSFADNDGDIAVLEHIFSDSFKSLSPGHIVKKASALNLDNLTVADGVLDLSGMEVEIPKSIEVLSKELKEMEKSLLQKRKELDAAKDMEAFSQAFESCKGRLEACKFKIREVKQKESIAATVSSLDNQRQSLDEKIASMQTAIKEKEKELANIKAEAAALGNQLQNHDAEIIRVVGEDGYTSKLKQIQKKIPLPSEIDDVPTRIEGIEINLAIDGIVDYAQKLLAEYLHLREKHKSLLSSLHIIFRSETGAMMNNPDEFLAWLRERMYRHDDKQKRAAEILEGVSSTYAADAIKLLEAYDEVRQHVVNSFNRILANYQVSNLSKVSIRFLPREERLKEIKAIRDAGTTDLMSFIRDEGSDLTLAKYIKEGADVGIGDLFDVALEFRDLHDKPIAKNQSNGTMKMVSMMVLLVMLQNMVDTDESIPFLFDEISNVDGENMKQFLSFCKTYKLVPIFASATMLEYRPNKTYYVQVLPSGHNLQTENHAEYWRPYEQVDA